MKRLPLPGPSLSTRIVPPCASVIARAIVRPGIRFRQVHAAAMQVIARKTAEWGFLPVSAEESLAAELQYHRG